jgi:DNA-binding IclR family transcriptional regulator
MNPRRPTADHVLDKIARLIKEEFEESPSLRMSVREASRFWALDEMTCGQVLTRLQESGFLARDADDRYRVSGRGTEYGSQLRSIG